MGQVRKDILNGWKEIGGYVGRDIRTVERWEKQRGLPVRRVPGAGRATVYALIPEVDQWLSKTSLNDDPGEKLNVAALERTASDLAGEPDRLLSPELPPGEEQFTMAAVPLEQPTSEIAVTLTSVRSGSRWWMKLPRRDLVTRVAFAGSLVLLGAVIWPLMVQARRDRSAEASSRAEIESRAVASVPYRSRVPGVDDLYLSGMYFYEQRTADSLQRSLEDFDAAIEKDPNYAPAYVGLANTYSLLRQYSHMPDAEAYPKAKAAAEHAIALDAKLPQAHASLGFIDFFWSWNAAEAEKQFRTAIALDPGSILAHHWYGSMLAHEGRYPEAIEQLDLAQRLEPTSSAILSIRALAVGLSGHRDVAVRSLNDVVRTAPPSTSPHFVLATLSLMQPRDLPRFLEESANGAALRHDTDEVGVLKAAQAAYGTGGERAMWTRILAREETLHVDGYDRNYAMAQAEAALGRNDAAISDLMQLAERREPSVMGVLMDPTLESLRHDARFPKLLAEIGLERPATMLRP